MTSKPLTVAVVGATGVVGRTMIQVLRERRFAMGELRLMASGRSAGSSVQLDGLDHPIVEAVPEAEQTARFGRLLHEQLTPDSVRVPD